MAKSASKATSRAAVFFIPKSYPRPAFTNKSSPRLPRARRAPPPAAQRVLVLLVVRHLALFANRVACVALDRILVFRNPSLTRNDSMMTPVVRRFVLRHVVAPVVADVVGAVVRVHQERADDRRGTRGNKHGRCRVGLNGARNKDERCCGECDACNDISEDISIS